MPCGLVRDGISSTTSPSRWSVSPGRTGFIQRRSSTPAPMSGCGPNGRTCTVSLIAMAAVCHPEAASPLKAVVSAATSSRWNGCGSNSDANRLISSAVTVASPLLKRIPSFRSSNHSIMCVLGLPQVQFLEEIIALVVDDDEGRKVLDLDAPDRFHAELGIFHHPDLLDAVFGEVCCRAADRAEIEAAVLLAGLAHRDRAIALGHHHHRAACGLELVDEAVH